MRRIDRHAGQKEIDVSTCPGPKVSCLLITQDINKLKIWKYEDKSIFKKIKHPKTRYGRFFNALFILRAYKFEVWYLSLRKAKFEGPYPRK
jgi:hypothetical protein